MTDRYKEALDGIEHVLHPDTFANASEIAATFTDHWDTIRASLTAAGGWQDISSAPKDGTKIWACYAHHPEVLPKIVSWQTAYKTTTWFEGDANWGWDHPGLTHWQPLQPLPTPPTAEKGRRDE